MDENLLIQIAFAVIITCVIFYIGTVLYANMEIAITDIQATCDNLTPETYNITQYHEACKYNETTGKYDLNITVINDVRT